MSGDVEVSRDDRVLRVTLNRPTKKNALTRAM
jgi:enoyl-CoA hydratase/carnithine racemase